MKKSYKIAIGLGFVAFIAIAGIGRYFWLNLEKYLYPTMIPPESYWVDMDEPLRQQISRVEIAGVLMDIPTMYFDTRLKPGVKQDAILLEVIWPEMTSTLELKNRQEYEKVWRQERSGGWILVEPTTQKTPFDKVVPLTEHGRPRIDPLPEIYGLKGRLIYTGLPQAATPWKEIYTEQNEDGHIESWILCSPLSDFSKYPTCSHRFINNGLYYDISYNKAAFFSEWRQQRQRAIDFVNSMKVSTDKNAGDVK